MIRDQFAAMVEAFFQGAQPYRHLYLWHGEVDELSSLLPSGRFQSLDCFCLAAGLSRYPFARDEANELLRDALRSRLRDWYAEDASAHPILMVTGCELLARYRIGLQPFYEVLTGHSMVILVCSAEDATYDPAGRLPAYVRCEPNATLAYLSRLVEDGNIIESS
jgi:hypothetical protein